MYLLGPSTFSPIFASSKTSSELHKLSKIKNVRSALRAEMFVSQERRRATQTFENQTFLLGASRRKGTQTNKGGTFKPKSFPAFKVFTKDVIPGYSKQDVRARCEGCFSLGASRRNVPLAGPHPSYTRAHYKGTLQGALQGALQGYTTRVTFKISLGFPA